ncbi:MAG TPA: hypothetical protein VLJ39_11935, partial [Tepidisphaeraceae bacterium]|nr:hypothetical protein [Tepidisphaeraceae bacterium]
SEMDSDAPAEHGFTKGELNDLLIWELLGLSSSWTGVPLRSQTNLDEKSQLLLNRYLDFRGNIAGLYYSTPRARRWGLWLDLASWEKEYEKLPTRNARKAAGAMFMQEVVGNRLKYPSIDLPKSLPEEGAENTLAQHLRGWIEKHPLTFSEDQSLRQAMKTFAAANALNVRSSGGVKLPGGQVVALDPDADQPEAAKRQAWLQSHLSGSSQK